MAKKDKKKLSDRKAAKAAVRQAAKDRRDQQRKDKKLARLSKQVSKFEKRFSKLGATFSWKLGGAPTPAKKVAAKKKDVVEKLEQS